MPEFGLKIVLNRYFLNPYRNGTYIFGMKDEEFFGGLYNPPFKI